MAYYDYVRRCRQLEPGEAEALVVPAQNGDRRAMKLLIEGNLRLVLKIARECSHRKDDLDDLIQEGNHGMFRAVAKFDPTRGVKFITYAAHWIRAHILHYNVQNFSLVRVGTTQAQRRMFFQMRKLRAELQQQGVVDVYAAMAETFGVSLQQVTEMEQRLSPSHTMSLDATIGEVAGHTLGDVLSSRQPLPDTLVIKAQQVDKLAQIITNFRASLTHRDAVIFNQRMVAENPVTLDALGEQLGISRERVRQILMRIQERFKQLAVRNGVTLDYIDETEEATPPAATGATSPQINPPEPHGPVSPPSTPSQRRPVGRQSKHNLTYQGRTQTVVAWAEEFHLTPAVVHTRLSAGMTLAEALTKPYIPRPRRAVAVVPATPAAAVEPAPPPTAPAADNRLFRLLELDLAIRRTEAELRNLTTAREGLLAELAA